MGLQSLLYYAALTWLPSLYVSRGWSQGRAGLLLGLFSATQLLSALALPVLADRSGDHRPWLALTVGTTTAMLVAFAVAPTAAPWLWSAVLGLGVGGQFALALTLLATGASTPAAAARLSGMALLVGYLLASTGPVLAGAVYDASRGYRAPFLVLAGIGAVILAIGVAAVAVSPKTFGLNQGLNNASSGRADLVTGGLHMFGDRPVWGFGSGSFVRVYRRQHPNTTTTLAASHTIAITIAAEQGVIGEVAYVALVLVALIALLRGARGDPARAAIAAASSKPDAVPAWAANPLRPFPSRQATFM
jgi:MFS family permease